MTPLQQNITQHLINELAKELDVHYACLSVQEHSDGSLRIILWTSGSQKTQIGYFPLRFKHEIIPSVGAYYETRDQLACAFRACNTVEEWMKKEGWKPRKL